VHRRRPRGMIVPFLACAAVVLGRGLQPATAERFEGQYYHGEGDVEYLRLLDVARRMFDPDPEFQNLPMFYMPTWNGFVEGPTWGAWWIQNSYGPTYAALPFWQEPYVTFLQNSHDLWFDQMGDGKRSGANNWVPPDGCLCDAASPGWIYYKQGDGRIDIHDWGMEFTAAGVVLQAEALLVSRDAKALARYLPKLERSANFVESRRDPKNNLFLAGPAGNLLAPSFAGWKKPDGTYDKAYLAGLSITYIAALDRLIELEKMAASVDKVKLYSERRELARKGLPLLVTDEGYFIKSLDPDGTRHGVFGAKKHGYFEAVANHDAICFRVADDAQAERIYRKIASIPELRRNDLIITNHPSLDDMYTQPTGLWEFGRWVNGGHWSTCEARMILAYFRLGKYDDARKSMKRILDYARRFRTDNPLVAFGGDVYQPGEPINCVYDTWGVPGALIRGLFEYLYTAEGLTLLPHVPPGIVELQQRFPIRFGEKRLYLMTIGSGPITAVTINGEPWAKFDAKAIALPYDQTPGEARVQILLGNAAARPMPAFGTDRSLPPAEPLDMKMLAEVFPIISPTRLPLRIGASGDAGNRFLGDIGPCRVFRRALKPDEVAALAQGDTKKLDKDPALAGHWKYDRERKGGFPGNSNAQLIAKIIGDVQVVDSPHGDAVRLDGKGYLEVAHDQRLDLSRSCTLEAWVRPGKLPPGGGRILDKSRVGTSSGYLLDTFPGGSLRLIVQQGTLSHDARLPTGQWTHVAGTVDGDGTLALYVGGKQVASQKFSSPPGMEALEARVARLRRFYNRIAGAGKEESYEAAHAGLAIRYLATCQKRLRLLAEGKLNRLPEASQHAADQSYFATAAKLCDGLEKVLESCAKSADPSRKEVYRLWSVTKQ